MRPSEIGIGAGTDLRCRGWRQEGILRMLENTLANGQSPDDLLIYGGIGRIARDVPSLLAIIDELKGLENDETLVVQSGRAVARMRTFENSPRVILANANLIPRSANPKRFWELSDAGLTMHGQYTAGSWAYIGGQGIVQGTYETFAACATQSFDGTLAGRIVLTAGLGGMGQAQGRAVRMNGGAALIADVSEATMRSRLRSGAVDVIAEDLDGAWSMVRQAASDRQPTVVGLVANAADVAEVLLSTNRLPDIATDQTSAHDLLNGYVPSGLDELQASALRGQDPDRYRGLAARTISRHVNALRGMQQAGVTVFEYGNDLRQSAHDVGADGAFDIEGFVPTFIRKEFAVGRGPFRWVCLSGRIADQARLDDLARELFPDDRRLIRWLDHARTEAPIEGLPARICWLGHGDRERMALAINDLVATGELSAPVALTRDHLDSGSCAYPTRETEAMPDGSGEVADWPYLNALLNASGGADLVAIHQNAGIVGGSASAGMTVVCDGSELSRERIKRCLNNDPGIGVVRHASAGVPEARDYLARSPINDLVTAHG